MPEKSVIDPAARRLRNIDRRGLMRPMLSSQIVDLGLRIYRRTAWPMISAGVAPTLLGYIGLVQINAFVLPNLFTTHKPHDPTGQFIEVALALVVAVFASIPLIVIGASYPVVFSSVLTKQVMVGEALNLQDAAEQGRKKFLQMTLLAFPTILVAMAPLGLAITLMGISSLLEARFGAESWQSGVASVLTILGFVAALFSIPIGLSAAAIAGPALACEPVDWKTAWLRSRTLRKSYRIHGGVGPTLFHLIIVCLVGYFAIDAACAIVILLLRAIPFIHEISEIPKFGTIFTGMLESIPTYISWLFTVPLFSCGCTVAYLERRVRVEALDVELMSEDIINGKTNLAASR